MAMERFLLLMFIASRRKKAQTISAPSIAASPMGYIKREEVTQEVSWSSSPMLNSAAKQAYKKLLVRVKLVYDVPLQELLDVAE